MVTARELLLNGDIEATDYRIIKDQCNEKITRLEARFSGLNAENYALLDIKPIAEEAMNSLRLLDEFYEKADVVDKR